MNCDNPLPRVNFEFLQRFVGRKVLLLGQVENIDGRDVRISTSDGGTVTVLCNSLAPFDTKFVEIEGTVADPRTVQEESHVNITNDNFDLGLYNELVKLENGEHMNLFLS